jgi:hypothetical protein
MQDSKLAQMRPGANISALFQLCKNILSTAAAAAARDRRKNFIAFFTFYDF